MNYLNKEIVVIGLGYVGLPLAVKLSSVFNVIVPISFKLQQ